VVPAKTVLSLTAEFSEVDDTRSINADQGGGWKDGGGGRWGGICSLTELDLRRDLLPRPECRTSRRIRAGWSSRGLVTRRLN